MLLTFEKQNEIKPISNNNKKLFTQINQEVEELELDKLLSTAFYQDIVDNYDTDVDDKYKELVEGSTFEDCEGNTIKHKGLWYTLAYLNYSSYIAESSFADTFTGMVVKNRPDSQGVSQGAIKNLQKTNREIAFNYYEKTRKFLEENSDEFPLFNLKKERRVNNFRIKGYRKTIK